MIGERIHSYEIKAHLGQGGMGNVYLATDEMLGREVALKMLHPQLTMQPLFLERFKKEARVLAQLLHPNIAVIYNFIEQNGNHFMVMEYVEGVSLDDLLKKYRTLPASFLIPVFIQALEGLQHAHRKNIFHRDVKPSNLMISEEGILKLMDFGIAKVAGEQKLTQVNKIVGTIEFMAPELIEGKDASVASDIYSMGATMYELLTGQLPFESDTDFNLMQAILKKKVTWADKINSEVPHKLAEIISKSMDKNPANRFSDAREFQQALVVAFPGSRNINTAVLSKISQKLSGSATRSVITRSGETVVMTTEFKNPSLPNINIKGLKSKLQVVFSNRKNQLIAAAVLLFLILSFTLISLNKNGKTDYGLANEVDSVNAGNKTGPGEINATSTGENGTANIIQTIPANNTEHPNPFPETPPTAVKEPSVVNTPSKKTVVKEVAVEEKKPEAKEVQSQVVAESPKKDIYISDSKVEVILFLRTRPDMNQRQKEEQRVSFTVTKPVVYNGVTIIRQGASATGTITIGRVMTDIQIDNVEAANGKRIGLKTAKSHGRRSDIEDNNTFTAYIVQGTRINF